MGSVNAPQVATAEEAMEGLPESVQLVLGELAGAAREGLLALSIGVALGVVHELMAAEVDEACGPKGQHDPDRTATPLEHRARLVDARRAPGAGKASADALARRRAGAPAAQLRALRLARPAHRPRPRADRGRGELPLL